MKSTHLGRIENVYFSNSSDNLAIGKISYFEILGRCTLTS